LYLAAATDRALQRDLWTACSRSVLFYVNAFVWTFDPRKPNPKLPFITYPYQDEGFLAMNSALPRLGTHTSESDMGHDLLIEKSRDMGASWMCLTAMQWRWHFHDLQTFLFVSRKEQLVDGSGDSMFGHVRFILKNLPSWLRPEVKDNKLKLWNMENGSKLEGESTTDNIGRGGRRTGMVLDEFAAFEGGGDEALSATADNTNCRFFNSTPNGTGNAFYAQREKGTARLRFHWSRHPEKARGLYRPDGEILDTSYEFPPDFVFRDDVPPGEEGLRSPWYDRECDRRAHPVEIATQLDIDYQGSAYPFFDPATLNELKRLFCEDPCLEGNLTYQDHRNPVFESFDGGLMRVWMPMGVELTPRDDRDYVVGADISAGSGASDSVLSVADRTSNEKVAEFATNQMSPSAFARMAVAMCYYWKGPGGRPAFLVWESQGPGSTFGKTVVDELSFTNVYFMRDERRLSKRESDKPGWGSTLEGKKDLLTTYRDQLFSRTFVNPSYRALNQAAQFVYQTNGRIEHSGTSSNSDPSDHGHNHGDVVIADALAVKILTERKKAEKKPVHLGSSPGSFAWRREERGRDTKNELW
jgi:hypothetical protein